MFPLKLGISPVSRLYLIPSNPPGGPTPMTQPRSQLVSPSRTRYYHCVSRCVRRAWLCGRDSYSGENFDHRKPWLLERMRLLAEVFAIRVAAYAVMSNHYHVVLYLDLEQSRSWDRDEVIGRWRRLFSGDPLARAHLRGELRTGAEFRQLDALVETWRERLCDLSWFMRCLNEHMARRANAEDACRGRFWEGRFKSRALLDDAALLSCMAYVDLNPVRAGICDELEESDFTSVQARLREIAEAARGLEWEGEATGKRDPAPVLMPFRPMGGKAGGPKAESAVGKGEDLAVLPFGLKDYVELVDWTGRMARKDKRGSIPRDAATALSALNLDEKQWRALSLDIQREAIAMFHGLDRLAAWERRQGKKAA